MIAVAIRGKPVPSLPVRKRRVAAVAGRQQYLGIPIKHRFNANRRRKVGQVGKNVAAPTQAQYLADEVLSIDRIQRPRRNLVEN